MTDNNATKTGRYTYRNDSSRLRQERKQRRILQLIFALFCVVLILSVVLVQAMRY